jgi:hypothetical protein
VSAVTGAKPTSGKGATGTTTQTSNQTSGPQTTTLPIEEGQDELEAWLERLSKERPSSHKVAKQLEEKLPFELFSTLKERDGAARLLKKLPEAFPPENIAVKSSEQRAWELTGVFFKNQGRFHQALPIFAALYDHMLAAQEQTTQRCHKGMPLIWISDCYWAMGFPVLAKRYLTLTLCEDAVQFKGIVDPDRTGVYFRLVWRQGLPDAELRRYAKKVYALWTSNPTKCLYPEWILQELDQNWMMELPAPAESLVYRANTRYIRSLLPDSGDSSGEDLERLAEYVLSCMPGCRTRRRQRSLSTDYDIVCSMEGFDVDFRSEFGRYFVCECKDWNYPANFSTMAKFCRVLDSTKSRFGILFSSSGLSGYGKTEDAEREQLKVFQDRGMVIVVVDKSDLERVANGGNFIQVLRAKYEKVRLDLTHSKGALSNIYSKDAVLAAIREYGELGQATFLTKYGFGQAKKYFVEVNGNLYDAHAVFGVAHAYEHPDRGPLGPNDFSPGRSVAEKLESLGFEIHIKP